MNIERHETPPEQAVDLQPEKHKDRIQQTAEKTEKPHSVLKELQTRQKIRVKKPKVSEKDPDIEEEL